MWIIHRHSTLTLEIRRISNNGYLSRSPTSSPLDDVGRIHSRLLRVRLETQLLGQWLHTTSLARPPTELPLSQNPPLNQNCPRRIPCPEFRLVFIALARAEEWWRCSGVTTTTTCLIVRDIVVFVIPRPQLPPPPPPSPPSPTSPPPPSTPQAMPYNLRSEESLKRPASQTLVWHPKRPCKMLPRKPSARHQSELETILNKEVLRPLTLFESIFAAYPIVQSVVQNLTTPDVMVLSITTPVLRRFLKENCAFRVFSNHREVMATDGPNTTYGAFEHLRTYKSFANNVHMTKLLYEYINPESITSLVLDGTDIDFSVTLHVCFFAKNLMLLSLKFCHKIEMLSVSTLLESRKGWPRFPQASGDVAGGPSAAIHTFLPALKALRVRCVVFCFLFFFPATCDKLLTDEGERRGGYFGGNRSGVLRNRNGSISLPPLPQQSPTIAWIGYTRTRSRTLSRCVKDEISRLTSCPVDLASSARVSTLATRNICTGATRVTLTLNSSRSRIARSGWRRRRGASVNSAQRLPTSRYVRSAWASLDPCTGSA